MFCFLEICFCLGGQRVFVVFFVPGAQPVFGVLLPGDLFFFLEAQPVFGVLLPGWRSVFFLGAQPVFGVFFLESS